MKYKIKAHVKEKTKETIEIDTPYIRLDAFLKLCGAAETGGHAKLAVNDGEVKVNGETCLQRGKKLRDGDSAELDNRVYIVRNNTK